MRLRKIALLAIAVLVSVLVLGSHAQAVDNHVGTWKLNLAKSKFSPGPPPRESTLTIEAQPNGLKITVHGINAEGQPVHFEMSPKYDGKDYPMTGNPDADTISLKKIDDYTMQTIGKKAGTPMLTIRSVVSKDGMTRTSTQQGRNAKGQNVNNTLVYNKQ